VVDGLRAESPDDLVQGVDRLLMSHNCFLLFGDTPPLNEANSVSTLLVERRIGFEVGDDVVDGRLVKIRSLGIA
jgi:hypothetical protein